MNVLFVCSKNQWRSPTAEKIYARHSEINVRSAGTASSARRTVSRNDIAWADLIVAMEDKHASRMRADFPGEMRHAKVAVLDIPDEYRYMDPELVTLLKESIDALLE